MSTSIVEVQKAVAELDRVAAGIAELKSLYAGIVYDVRTTKGMDEAKAARAAIREPRYEIEKVRKAAKAPILKLGKELDDRAKAITSEILAIEEPIDWQIKNEEARKEAEKKAKIEAEQKRVAGIQAKIDAIRNWPTNATGKPSSLVEQQLRSAEDYVIGADFEEFADTARAALETSRVAMRGILAERQAHEAEQARIKAEREELARLRAEQQKREAEERARIAEEERKAKAERDAEAARQAEQLRAQRDESERIARERQAEFDRIEREKRTAWEAQEKKLAAERAELERQQEEFRKAQEPVVLATMRPTDDEIIGCVAAKWGVDEVTATDWVLSIGFRVSL